MASILRGVGHGDRSRLCSRDKSRIARYIGGDMEFSWLQIESDRFRSHETSPRVGAAESRRCRVIADAPGFA